MTMLDWHGQYVAVNWGQACKAIPSLLDHEGKEITPEMLVAVAETLEGYVRPSGYTLLSFIVYAERPVQILFKRIATTH